MTIRIPGADWDCCPIWVDIKQRQAHHRAAMNSQFYFWWFDNSGRQGKSH